MKRKARTGHRGVGLRGKPCGPGDARPGYAVRVMVRTEGQALAFRSLGVETAAGDLQKPESLPAVVRGVGSILHIASIFRQAGLPDEVYRDVNATGTERLIDAAAAAGVARFIHCSTNGVHGGIKNPPGNEDSPVKPGDVYQESKWEGADRDARLRIGAHPRRGAAAGDDLRAGGHAAAEDFPHDRPAALLYIGRGDAFVHYIDVRDLARAFGWRWSTPRSTRAPTSSPAARSTLRDSARTHRADHRQCGPVAAGAGQADAVGGVGLRGAVPAVQDRAAHFPATGGLTPSTAA
ncbi:MAG: NAD-dependent epimerase/dehydratase family protein [Kiritimatiellia bacterium]